MPKLNTYSSEEAAAHLQSVVGKSWLSPAIKKTCKHWGMEQVFADASFKCALMLAISHVEAGQSSEFDQKVPGG